MVKRQLLILSTLIFSLNCLSQITFKKGYFIDSTNQKVNCLIRTVDWNNNPTEFDYKISENDQPKKATIKSVKEFALDNISKYIRVKVDIDRSSEILDKLSKERNPIFKQEVIFLEVMLEGKANLYKYLDGSLTRYFYNIDNSSIKQLIFKNYLTSENKYAANNQFRQQLWSDLRCPDFKMSKFENLNYYKKDLLRIFTEYSECFNHDLVRIEPKERPTSFSLTIRPSVRNSSLSIQSAFFNSGKVIDFGNKQTFGIGLEAEVILPINKSKWAIAVEPTYQTLKSERIDTDISSVFGGPVISTVDYSVLEIPFSVRHYFFISTHSKIFINASYVLALSFESNFKIENSFSTSSSLRTIHTGQNLGYGLGYKLHNKYSIEMRYQARRDFLESDPIWSSNYTSLSVIFGYAIF